MIFFSIYSKIRAFSGVRGISDLRMVESHDTIYSVVYQQVQSSLRVAFGDEWKSVDPLIFPAKAAHGDYQSNVAMSLSKQLKLPPKDIASKIIDSIPYGDVLERADSTGPGFINLHLSNTFIQRRILRKLLDESTRCGILKTATPQRVIVDFSSPNIAKEMHVGHLRSTIIGDCLSKVLEFLGHDVLRLNHVGDWGTQFGMLIRYLKETYPEMIRLDLNTQAAAEQLNIGDLVEFYKAAKVRFDADPAFQSAARQEVVKLQAGDKENIQVWQAICEKSRKEFKGVYDLLGVNIIERGESFYNPFLVSLVAELDAKGVVVNSEGAKCIFLPGYKNGDGTPMPMIIQKSDGGFLYATTDLAAIKHRTFNEKADRVIYVTDSGQAQHFAMVFDAAKTTKLLPQDRDVELTHVPFGLVLGEDGKKIKTRAGDSVKLKELLHEAVKIAEEGFVARLTSSLDNNAAESGAAVAVATKLDQAQRAEIAYKAKVMGIAAVKYADLAMNRESNYKFSFSKMLSLTGNTAPYMLYAFVRIKGIQRKAAEKFVSSSGSSFDIQLKEVFRSLSPSDILLLEAEEVTLAKQLLRFDEILLEVSDKLYPNKLCDYLFDLSQKFNQFYEKCPVVKAPTKELQLSRTALCTVTSGILHCAFSVHVS